MTSYSFIPFLIFGLIIFFSGLVTVQQGSVAVITMFGKYRRVLQPGLNFKIPLIEQIVQRNWSLWPLQSIKRMSISKLCSSTL
jgi:regulator of protease activity HflC (stomatin/prohibitin superfamily)